MTYCVGMLVDEGLVFLSDTRTNAGVDHVSTSRKMVVFEDPGERVLVLLVAGNLAITQATLQVLTEPQEAGRPTLWTVPSMVEAARLVGEAVREVHRRDSEALTSFGVEFNCSFILGGQLRGQSMRLFQIYAAGNFIETSSMNPYFQIGESKYGKPIIDRVLTPATPLDEAAKCALISMDSTLRSNLSVGLPLDLLVYECDSLRVTRYATLDQSNEYFQMIHSTWGERLRQVFGEIPDPVWSDAAHVPRRSRGDDPVLPIVPRSPLDGHGVQGGQARPAQTLAQVQPSAPHADSRGPDTPPG
ncbi:proteasome-type protease [Paraburkholderia caballeronis]|uniref:Putative proteasome-type protease n=1 Tax=Paraburkholderia caballeronis TaxID=416943 RepID=A0A1H7NSX5_9BURK|nr:proteasome-type protease [Paraburkholderia caballeronis]PXW25545.1 putative proteasome-type protease [Paraburkholderia caballeronis]PXX01152.1 putative proteasome-type protease [Paraburkholderia caballeronis]RAJ99495.1 putative proteasome-type protease [Paraburkholderia caballeronis]TDV07207.1 putative proteasome-type protease [Paraburkholderia caballeronis]TDV11351.1 putative proteasome-type protease [Paraburkholderia caballeronis]